MQLVWYNGIVVVASAGNLGDQPGTVTKPADDPLIISVGATNEYGTPERDDDDIPAFGSRGPTQDGLTKPDLVAPGTRLVSLRAPGSTVDTANPQARVGEEHFRGSGTSFAAPLVAGVVAQVLSADPGLTPDQVKHGILSTATPVQGDLEAQGAGSIRAARALRAAREGVANRGVTRSIGTGSLDGARGSAKVKVKTTVVSSTGGAQEVLVPVVGERTAEVAPTLADAPLLGEGDVAVDALDDFNRDELLDRAEWDASHWGASHWGASHWGASQWGASHWGASHWGASHWGASHWGSSDWWASSWG
ncbi:MAG: peptidase [Thermoleophilia bacterium]|nr:peptidase [Thermoleophilia bacterium]